MAPGRTWAQIAAGKSVPEASVPFAEAVGIKSVSRGVDSDPSPLPSLLSAQVVAGVTGASPCPSVPTKAELDIEQDEWCVVGDVVRVGPCLPELTSAASYDEKRLNSFEEQMHGDMEASNDEDAEEPEKCEDTVLPSPGDAQTDKCISGSAVPHNLVSASPRAEDALHRDDMSSTAASERERSESCILCSGSGLLCVGLLADACPLCDAEPEEPDGGETLEPEAPCGKAMSEVSSGGASPSEAERAPESKDDSLPIDEDDSCPQEASERVYERTKDSTKMTAPPGLGPPGIWVWPHESKTGLAESEESKEESKEDANTITWPGSSVDSEEVEFVGRVAQGCFGHDFEKMKVTRVETKVEGKVALSIVNMQLHLDAKMPAHFLPPLARLQAMLARDQTLHRCQIFRMDRSKDNSTVHLTCAKVSDKTCWDVTKKGFCPRPGCTWEHPASVVMQVSCVGGSPSTAVASQKPNLDSDTSFSSPTIPAKDMKMVPPANGTMNVNALNSLNFGAFDDLMSDSSEEM